MSSARLVLSRHLCAVHNVRQLRRRVGPTTANQLSDVLGLKANSHRHTRHDKTVAPTSRPPPRRRPGRQLCLAARPPTRSDVVRQENVNTLWTAAYDENLNFFTKRHATRVIYRLTVQTLPDGLETQFAPPDTTQTGLSCRVRRAV